MIKVIIFDLGSVLFNENWEKLNEDMLNKFGISTLMRSNYGQDIQKIYDNALIGKADMKDVFDAICKSKGLKRDINEVCNFYKEAYKKDKIINQEGINLIKKLRKKFKIVCLTDTNHLHYESHKEQGILNLFDERFGSHEIGMRKNNPQAFKIILSKLKINPEEVLFIDDNIKNINNAKSIGINAIQFINNEQLRKEIKQFIEV